MDTFKNLKIVRKALFTTTVLLIFSVSFSQTNSNNSYALDFVNGLSTPIGDFNNFADNGFNSGFNISKNFCSNVSIGLSTNYTALPIKDAFGVSNEKWSSFSFETGPQYRIEANKISIQFYGRLGLSFINIPEITDYYTDTNFISCQIEKANTTGLNTRLGVNFGTKICKGLSFFIATDYVSTFNSNINYSNRNLDSAMSPSGTIDPDLASEIDFNKTSFNFSTLNINFGIQIDLNTRGCAEDDKTRATDYNSSRSNRTTSSSVKDLDNDSGDDGNDTRATDYNSSRSNRTTSSSINDLDTGSGDDDNDTKATDHNSSRSNKTSHTPSKEVDDEDDDDKTKATDHNSSRSNKTSHTPSKEVDDGNEDDNDDDKTKATDHNSSRSNKTSHTPAKEVDEEDKDNDDDGKTKATDHNSSRSNKTSHTPAKEVDDKDDKTGATDNKRI